MQGEHTQADVGAGRTAPDRVEMAWFVFHAIPIEYIRCYIRFALGVDVAARDLLPLSLEHFGNASVAFEELQELQLYDYTILLPQS